jgi:uncharacterized protein (TIGR02246 family)
VIVVSAAIQHCAVLFSIEVIADCIGARQRASPHTLCEAELHGTVVLLQGADFAGSSDFREVTMIRRLWCSAVGLGLVLCLSAAQGQQPSADEQAIQAAVQSYVKAFNAANAAAVADHWAENAQYVLPSGDRVEGKKAIRRVFEELFAAPQPPKIDVVKAQIRMISKDVAVEDGTVRILNADDEAEESSYLAIHVRQGKQWKLNTVRETTVPVEPESEAQTQLKTLAWLVGQWQEGSGDDASFSRFAWAKNRSFLTCQFKVPLGDDMLEGTQVIGWDPESKVIRSWMFDSHGGFGEGVWSGNAEGWTVKFVQLLPDGRRAAATNVYTRIDADTFQWKSIGRKVDGAAVAEIGPIRAVRR